MKKSIAVVVIALGVCGGLLLWTLATQVMNLIQEASAERAREQRDASLGAESGAALAKAEEYSTALRRWGECLTSIRDGNDPIVTRIESHPWYFQRVEQIGLRAARGELLDAVGIEYSAFQRKRSDYIAYDLAMDAEDRRWGQDIDLLMHHLLSELRKEDQLDNN